MNNECCTSIDKSRKSLSDLTGGKLNISKGMISKLCKEFALKTEQERKNIYADILLSPVMHTDCTNAKVNGKSCYVYVCATPDGKTLYFAREKKAQAVSFRSFDSIDYLCQCMSMLVVMRQEETANIFDRVSRIFG